MSWLDLIFKRNAIYSKRAKQAIIDELLNLIDQSKEKDLPLTWLTSEIKKL